MKYLFCVLHMLLCFTMIAQDAVLEKADILVEELRYLDAQQLLEKEIKNNYSNARLEKLGDVYSIRKNWDKAVHCYGELVEEHPESSNYHYKYGGALGMKALSVNKIKALTYLNDIKKYFKKAAELDRQHIGARWALIEFYLQLPGIIGGSVKKAGMYARELSGIRKIEGLLAYAYIAYDERDFENAQKYALEAIKLSDQIPKDYERNTMHYQLGKIASRYGVEASDGIRHLKWYIDNYTDNDSASLEWAFYHLARINRQIRNKEEALKWIKKAISLRKNFKQALDEQTRIQAM